MTKSASTLVFMRGAILRSVGAILIVGALSVFFRGPTEESLYPVLGMAGIMFWLEIRPHLWGERDDSRRT